MIAVADEKDVAEIVQIVNLAYRGESSKQGWTTEADLLLGDKRTDEESLLELMQGPGSIFLKYLDEQNLIKGSVFLSKKENGLYLGMLTVSPLEQAKGIGRQLMTAAENYARTQNCRVIFMRVITVRKELIEWYEKQGFRDTGLREPVIFDTRFGIPTQELEFMILEKPLLM
jgi:GNAT superfamily N-acetyltransferase